MEPCESDWKQEELADVLKLVARFALKALAYGRQNDSMWSYTIVSLARDSHSCVGSFEESKQKEIDHYKL